MTADVQWTTSAGPSATLTVGFETPESPAYRRTSTNSRESPHRSPSHIPLLVYCLRVPISVFKKEGSNNAVGAHRTPHSHPRAKWWRFQNDVRCVRSPYSAVLRVHLSRKVKVLLSLNQTRWRPVKIVRVLFSRHYSAASWRRVIPNAP